MTQVKKIGRNINSLLQVEVDGVSGYKDIIYVPSKPKLRKMILEKGHKNIFSIYLRVTEMYQSGAAET